MIPLEIKINHRRADEMLAALKAGLTKEATMAVVMKEAAVTMGNLKRATPVRWTGQTRNAWTYKAVESAGAALVFNRTSKPPVMWFLERGTANGGTGRIYPKTARALYIPLRRQAALGWNPSLIRGVDYILRKWVRGIKPRWIARTEAREARARLKETINRYVRDIVQRFK